jgi:fumarylacetoacetase
MTIDHTHDVDASSWVPDADGHADFPIQNLPFGVFSIAGQSPRIGCAIGDWVLDVTSVAQIGILPCELSTALDGHVLNALFALPKQQRRVLRHALFDLLSTLQGKAQMENHVHPASLCSMHLPFQIGDYTDFYVGIHHATNIGKLFRPDNPLLPNYKHIPIGYHGRASSVRVSGTPVRRPYGQLKASDQEKPEYRPCRRLDHELELGVWIAEGNALGQRVPIADAGDLAGGFCLLNDWSARDIQAWEYQPLGPFLAKNFMTSISPWVITAEALAPFRVAQQPRPKSDPEPLDYLKDTVDAATGALSLTLCAHLTSPQMRDAGMAPHQLTRGSATAMYWTVAQMIAHHTSNGCDLRPGDLLGTGTISGATRDSMGSLMEISESGTLPINLPSGEARCFLEDGDELILSAFASRDGFRSIGFGECRGVIETAE